VRFASPQPHANYGGGSYSNCLDLSQLGVAAVVSCLQAPPREVKTRCETGHHYLLNNYNPRYFGDGNNAYTDTNQNNFVYTIPPSIRTSRSIRRRSAT
jgi:phospholipase C